MVGRKTWWEGNEVEGAGGKEVDRGLNKTHIT